MNPHPAPVLSRLGTGVAVALVAGCVFGEPSDRRDPTAFATAEIPAWGTASSFDVASWNVDWFGDPGNGPEDEALQSRRLQEVIGGAEIDLWALQEVVSRDVFAELIAALSGYDGLLADDPSVEGGAEWYRDFGDQEQKLALIWRASMVEVESARVVLTGENHAFAGRPPLEVALRLDPQGVDIEGRVVVVHAKASADEASRARRQRGADALLRYLDATWPTLPVWVLGDFNDDIDRSIVAGAPSPYRAIVDAVDWSFTTGALSERGASSTTGYADMIDHHLVSDEAGAWYEAGSSEVWRVDRWIDDFSTTTSDHYPVLTRYTLPGG